MKRKLLTLALALALCVIQAGALGPAASSNGGRQTYATWSRPVTSYLYDNGSGLTRVEYTDKKVVVEDYSAGFELLTSRSFDPELPIFGGFYAGEDYNYLVFGQTNTEQDDSKEVIRVVQYDKAWNRIGDAGLFGANTTVPFDAGSLRCSEYGGYLYVRTCHEMYTSSDGLNHQANVTFCVREKDMEITDAFYDVMNVGYGYVSHSFNQFILVDQDGNIITADHGDAYPRSHVLMRYPTKAGEDKFVPGFGNPTTTIDLVQFPGGIGQNATGSSLGGLAETSTGYVVAYNWNGEDAAGDRDVYLAYVGKDLKDTQTVTVAVPGGASTPQLAPTGPEGGYLLWTGGKTLYYAAYDAQGKLGEVKSTQGALSDCRPIPYGDGSVWYVTNESNKGAPVFYTLNDSGVTAHPVAAPVTPDDIGTAYASTQTFDLDGKAVEFQCYALKDRNGGATNYVKLRDLATRLNGTAAQFSVGWDGDVTITTKTAYTPNGSELNTPFSGDRAYTKATAETKVNGKAVEIDAFVLTDDAGGGHTYYQLRDLGRLLGFRVDWTAERGVFIESDKPYSSAPHA